MHANLSSVTCRLEFRQGLLLLPYLSELCDFSSELLLLANAIRIPKGCVLANHVKVYRFFYSRGYEPTERMQLLPLGDIQTLPSHDIYWTAKRGPLIYNI